MKPCFDSNGFKAYQMVLDNKIFNRLIDSVKELNEYIALDDSLGEEFRIGHSYFLNFTEKSMIKEALSNLVEYELIPLLKEFWFDEPTKVSDWSMRLRSAIQ
ncbi:hypothetical protein [Atopobacter phocae]|uniref:hypothetical protein n=1 Tax=Atopobacter phocae TaxID=136492 RepID=UPI00047078B3|nr:hypothetical protein [Atopobacter phocae]